MITQTLNSVSFSLKETHDFQWLQDRGDVFCVFDQQDSGNLCFGIIKNGSKQFVKYAGAKTVNYEGATLDAIDRLIQAIPIYHTLKHDCLVTLIDSFQTPEGYAMIFEWFQGSNLHEHWNFPPPEKYTNSNSPFFKFKQLSTNLRLKALDQIFSFHVEVERKGYVAIDFYDGSLLYNFEINEIKICDIDYYHKKPYVNEIGRMWGSSRFMSPEEFVKGSVIDERTNVYNMGSTAFCLLCDELNQNIDKWDGPKNLYFIAQKAIAKNKRDRFSCVKEFYNEWQIVLKNVVNQT